MGTVGWERVWQQTLVPSHGSLKRSGCCGVGQGLAADPGAISQGSLNPPGGTEPQWSLGKGPVHEDTRVPRLLSGAGAGT